MADILVVDDDRSVATAFERFLKHEGHRAFLASDASDAFRQVADHRPEVVFMDVRMPGVDGLQALQVLREQFPDVYVVIMTAHGTSQTSIDAIRAGAFEYVTKPLDLKILRDIIAHALTARRARDGKLVHEAEPAPATPVSLVGVSPSMQHIYKLIGRLATNDVPALVVGERGTGKALVVATIHQNSARRDGPFVVVDCGVPMSPEALDAELQRAHGGTAHLSNVNALSRPAQALVLRYLEIESAPSGGRSAASSVRILASSEVDLGPLVEEGSIGRTFFDRLSVITIRLKPLRERREDVPLLVRHFVRRTSELLARDIHGVDEPAMRRLTEFAWPGNAADLESVVKRACIVSRGEVITDADLGEHLGQGRVLGLQGAESALARAARSALHERLVDAPGGPDQSVYHDIVGVVEGALVNEALAITNGNQVKASELLGVNRATLRKKTEL